MSHRWDYFVDGVIGDTSHGIHVGQDRPTAEAAFEQACNDPSLDYVTFHRSRHIRQDLASTRVGQPLPRVYAFGFHPTIPPQEGWRVAQFADKPKVG